MAASVISRRRLLKAAGLGGWRWLRFGTGRVRRVDPLGHVGGALTELSVQLSWIKNYEFVGEYLATEKGNYARPGSPASTCCRRRHVDYAESIVLSGKSDSRVVLARSPPLPSRVPTRR